MVGKGVLHTDFLAISLPGFDYVEFDVVNVASMSSSRLAATTGNQLVLPIIVVPCLFMLPAKLQHPLDHRLRRLLRRHDVPEFVIRLVLIH